MDAETTRQTWLAFRAAEEVFGSAELPPDVSDAIHQHPPRKRAALARAFRAVAAQAAANAERALGAERSAVSYRAGA